MNDPRAATLAWQLRQAIEMNVPEANIGQHAQELARQLGGFADLSQMTPGAAALYLVSLVLSQPENFQ